MQGTVAPGTVAHAAGLRVVGLQNGSHLLAGGSEWAEAGPGWPRSAKRAREAFYLEANPNVDKPLVVQCMNKFGDQAHAPKGPVCKSALLSISISCLPLVGSCDRESLN